jgi:tRNA 2-selenouridine synthase
MTAWPSEARALIDLLLAETPLIDVRAPVEFSHGSIPGAVNLPLLNDEERAAVGTAYKKTGPDTAIELGMNLISGDVREQRIRAWVEFLQSHPNAQVYCFRGGLRSRSVKEVLMKEQGLDVPLISGGYKYARQVLMDTLVNLSKTTSLSVLTGFTGSGKTVFLRKFAKSQKVCDLEGLAKHRGSAFGKLIAPQPTQIDFENILTVDLLKLSIQSNETVWIEDESRMIGKVVVPDVLFATLSRAPLYVIERPRAERARALTAEYLTENYGLTDGESRPDLQSLEKFKVETENYLELIKRRLGGAEYQLILGLFRDAFQAHVEDGRFDTHEAWVDRLLEKYYDPVYLRHLDREKHRVVFSGSVEELQHRLSQNSPIPNSAS